MLPSFFVTRTGVPGRSPCGFVVTIVILEGVAWSDTAENDPSCPTTPPMMWALSKIPPPYTDVKVPS